MKEEKKWFSEILIPVYLFAAEKTINYLRQIIIKFTKKYYPNFTFKPA
jgi:hypothetical protein